ncbi:DUF559 domain-containing protein [Actinospongicola halichondriae]|uniref:DUF559 domain-containing protein n=1 Tax=Actinospongicola halichondriae TaxID=3236844 RepID=UPI003D428CA4
MFERIAAIAWRQHGAFTAAQAQGVGVSRTSIMRATSDGSIVRRRPRVYVIASAPRTERQDLMVAVLAGGAGALATGESALTLWCPEIASPNTHSITVPAASGVRSTAGCRVLRSSDLELAKAGSIDGIPVVGVARALLDSAIGLPPDVVLARINACQRHLPMSFGALVDTLHSHARRGRPGVATFRTALGRMTKEVPDSEFERLVLRDLAAVDIPSPTLHHVVSCSTAGPIELDLAWPDRRIDVELDGRDHLTRMKTARRDRQRDRALALLGWVAPRFVWDDYLDDPGAMVAEIVALVLSR